MPYLDYEGLKYLWSKISMEDYPNNETLIAVLNAIDQTKADKSEVGQMIYSVYITDSEDNIHKGVIENYNQQRPHFLYASFIGGAARGSGSIQINNLDPLPIGGNVSDMYKSLLADVYNSAGVDHGLYYCDGVRYIILPSGMEYTLQIAILRTIFKNYYQVFGSEDNPIPTFEEVLTTLIQNYEENNIQPIRDTLNDLAEMFVLVIQRMYELEEISSVDELPTIREVVNEEIQNHMNNLEPPVTGEAITTEHIYTYNGDTNDGVYDWVLNGSGHKMYAKLGELPEGTMNIVGSKITVTNHTNSSLTVHFTVTEEHLTRELSMYDGAMVAQATQTGFTQILQSVGYYADYSSVLCICTRPGKYIVSFGGWVEWVDFTETGIYGFETRTWGGNEYTSHFTFTSTVGSLGGASGTIGGTTSPVDYKGNEIQAFTRGICIGDSVTEGTLDHSGGTFNKAGTSYPAILKRLTGLDITNAGIAGTTSKTWYETSLNSSTNWGDWVNNEWFWREPTGTSLDYSGYDFAIIHLGINDIGNMGNITIDELLVDYETNIYNIINKLKEHNNGIKIFLATIVPSYAPSYNENYKAMNNKIRAIVEATANVYLLDLNDLSNLTMHSAYNVWHPTAIGYVKMAEEIKALISYTISQNLDEFSTIQFIGTDYTF